MGNRFSVERKGKDRNGPERTGVEGMGWDGKGRAAPAEIASKPVLQ